ncbi:MAG: hypothetical protein M3R38_10705 [Actinomycetota bacterium]|nr:hypothetical protein [Actinomycetota bacterium]
MQGRFLLGGARVEALLGEGSQGGSAEKERAAEDPDRHRAAGRVLEREEEAVDKPEGE